jgi:hypothetical protein
MTTSIKPGTPLSEEQITEVLTAVQESEPNTVFVLVTTGDDHVGKAIVAVDDAPADAPFDVLFDGVAAIVAGTFPDAHVHALQDGVLRSN